MEARWSPDLSRSEAPAQQEAKLVPWGSGDIGRAILALLVAIVVFAALAAGLERGLGLTRPLTSVILAAAVEAILMGVAWRFSVLKYRCPWSALGFRGSPDGNRSLGVVLAGAILALAISFAYVGVLHAIGRGDSLPPSPFLTERGTGVLALLTALAVLAAPVAEETFFRGFVFGGLRPRIGPWGAAGVSAGLFSLAHVAPATFIPIFGIGLVLAWVYSKTGSLWYPILAHLGYNGIVLGVSWA